MEADAPQDVLLTEKELLAKKRAQAIVVATKGLWRKLAVHPKSQPEAQRQGDKASAQGHATGHLAAFHHGGVLFKQADGFIVEGDRRLWRADGLRQPAVLRCKRVGPKPNGERNQPQHDHWQHKPPVGLRETRRKIDMGDMLNTWLPKKHEPGQPRAIKRSDGTGEQQPVRYQIGPKAIGARNRRPTERAGENAFFG